ncbi:MAG: hypothetical protein ABIS31_01960 [Candidatus Eisenbacteria bacterium]
MAFGADYWVPPPVFELDTRTDVWALDLNPGGGWTALPPGAVHPRPRFDALAMFDRARDRMLLAGGQSRNSAANYPYNESGHADDVWALQFESLVDVGPDPGRLPRGLRLASANPARRGEGWSVWCVLPRARTTRLEVVDVRGRVVWARDLEPGAVDEFSGTPRTVLVDGPGLRAAGIYFARLHGSPESRPVRLVRIAGG